MTSEDQIQNEIPEVTTPPAPFDVTLFRQAAMKLLRWCHDQGLLTSDAYFPGDSYAHPELTNLTAEGVAMLRQKLVRSIGLNEVRGTICIFLHRAAPGSRQLQKLPTECDGYPLKYYQGSPETINPLQLAQAANPCAVHRVATGQEFYTCGSSISVGNARGAGTLGCLVTDATGQIYGLSNNHVSGGCNYAPLGLPIIAPGVLDVSPYAPRPFTLGVHARQLPMLIGDPTTVDTSQNQDVALFTVTASGAISSMQQHYYDTPATSLPLAAGMRVKKVGRSSGLTVGQVICGIVGPSPVMYSVQEHNFNGAVFFDNMYIVHGIGDRFSEAGDSGSLVVFDAEDGSSHAVGIVVGGCASNNVPGGSISLIMPIHPILNLLQVELVAGFNI